MLLQEYYGDDEDEKSGFSVKLPSCVSKSSVSYCINTMTM